MSSRPRSSLIRAARYAAYAAAALVVLVFAAALAVPLFLDAPAVERELQAKLSQSVHGEVAWDKLAIRLLPSPRGALSRVRVEIPELAEVRAEQVDAHLRLLPLLRGRAEIAEVSLSKPVVRLRIAPAKEKVPKEPKPAAGESFHAVLDAIRGLAPGSAVDVENGEVAVSLPGQPKIDVRSLQLHGRTDSEGLALELRAAAVEIDREAGPLRVQNVSIAGKVGANGDAIAVRVSSAQLSIESLPGPLKLAGSVTVTDDAVKIGRADVSMADARALASATIGYGKQLRVEGTVSEATVGETALAWIWKTAGAPPGVALKTPIRVGVQHASWGPKRPLDLAATASFDSGPSVGVELGWTPKALDVRRAAVKDAASDASIALRLEDGAVQGRFSGSLQSSSLSAMLKGAKVPSGGVSGDLRVRFDRDHPERFSASGKLAGESVDLAWLLGRPVTVERFDVQADGQKLRVREASVDWAKQSFVLSGEIARAADGAPVIDAQVESPGVLVDALLQPVEGKPAPAEKKPEPKADEPLWTRWPLPVRGRIAVRSKFIQYGERKAEPVVATLTLEEQRASLDLQQVKLCGISFPLTAEAKPEGLLAFSVRLTAQKQQLEQTARCLTDRGVQMTGEFDLSAEIRSSGKRGELVGNLQGHVEAEARDGRVRQFPLILKILSVRDVADSLKKDGVRLEESGFPYRSINAKGRFDAGRFVIEESAFRSNSVGFAANGSISLSEKDPKPYNSDLTVLVAPLSGLDSLVRAIPILGNVVQGTLTSWPVRVSGDIRNPQVEAVSPGAITSEFVGMFQRTLKLPTQLLPKLTPPGAR